MMKIVLLCTTFMIAYQIIRLYKQLTIDASILDINNTKIVSKYINRNACAKYRKLENITYQYRHSLWIADIPEGIKDAILK